MVQNNGYHDDPRSLTSPITTTRTDHSRVDEDQEEFPRSKPHSQASRRLKSVSPPPRTVSNGEQFERITIF